MVGFFSERRGLKTGTSSAVSEDIFANSWRARLGRCLLFSTDAWCVSSLPVLICRLSRLQTPEMVNVAHVAVPSWFHCHSVWHM